MADIGCGHGAATIMMAQAFPHSRFVGYDSCEGSVQTARERARRAGVADRVRFEVANAADYPGRDFDLVTIFDALHDLGDPIGASAHVLTTLAADGLWMIVEPNAADQTEDNTNPFGRAFYAAWTLMCVPCAMKQGKVALGAQAGEARLRAGGDGWRLQRLASCGAVADQPGVRSTALSCPTAA